MLAAADPVGVTRDVKHVSRKQWQRLPLVASPIEVYARPYYSHGCSLLLSLLRENKYNAYVIDKDSAVKHYYFWTYFFPLTLGPLDPSSDSPLAPCLLARSGWFLPSSGNEIAL